MRILRGRRRGGMTLLEVMIALSILGVVLLGMGEFVGKFVRSTRESLIFQTASDLAVDRLEAVKGGASYPALNSFAATENPVSGYPGFQRVTQVTRTNTTITDHTTVTVTVTATGLTRTVKKTTVIARF